MYKACAVYAHIHSYMLYVRLTLSTLSLVGWTYAQTCGLHHGWEPPLRSEEKHGMFERAHAGLQQVGRGETVLQVSPLKWTFWP